MIALLIISISVALFTEAVTVSGRIIQKGKQTAEKYVEAENDLAQQVGNTTVTASLDFGGTSAEVGVNVTSHGAGSGTLYSYKIDEGASG